MVKLGIKVTGLAIGKYILCILKHFLWTFYIPLLLLSSEVNVNAFTCLHIKDYSIT